MPDHSLDTVYTTAFSKPPQHGRQLPSAQWCWSPSPHMDMAYLTLFHRGGVLVAHGADLHPSLPLLVALPEELLHDSLRPLSVHGQRFGRVAQVGAVHHVPQHLRRHNRWVLCFEMLPRDAVSRTGGAGGVKSVRAWLPAASGLRCQGPSSSAHIITSGWVFH